MKEQEDLLKNNQEQKAKRKEILFTKCELISFCNSCENSKVVFSGKIIELKRNWSDLILHNQFKDGCNCDACNSTDIKLQIKYNGILVPPSKFWINLKSSLSPYKYNNNFLFSLWSHINFYKSGISSVLIYNNDTQKYVCEKFSKFNYGEDYHIKNVFNKLFAIKNMEIVSISDLKEYEEDGQTD